MSYNGTNSDRAKDTLKCKEIMRLEINFVVINCQTKFPFLLSTGPLISRSTLHVKSVEFVAQ